jgi:hypothetical protein
LGASLLEENLEKKVELFKVPCMEMGGRLLWTSTFGWKLVGEMICSVLCKYAILRGSVPQGTKEIGFWISKLNTDCRILAANLISQLAFLVNRWELRLLLVIMIWKHARHSEQVTASA